MLSNDDGSWWLWNQSEKWLRKHPSMSQKVIAFHRIIHASTAMLSDGIERIGYTLVMEGVREACYERWMMHRSHHRVAEASHRSHGH